jgi:2-polyprenyl-3-methyl-5-hydroxy-6-metoxy-1,4-benzoquinol methylase
LLQTVIVDGYCCTGVTKALDIGCGVGSVSFELARHFDDVLGIEIASDQLAAARTLQQHGVLHYSTAGTYILQVYFVVVYTLALVCSGAHVYALSLCSA